MAKGRGITSGLYRAARLSNDIGAVASGKPSRIVRRGKNKIVGRSIAKAGGWKWLWK